MNVRQVAAPQPYSDLDRLPIGGGWRKAKANRVLADRDPYTGQVILEIPQADRNDLDDAYSTAATAQAAWAAELPATRATVFRRATEILEARGSKPRSNGRRRAPLCSGRRRRPTLLRGRFCQPTFRPRKAESTASQSVLSG